MKHDDDLRSAIQDLRLQPSGRLLAHLRTFESLLLEVAVPTGLISRRDAVAIRSRHILDALRAAPLAAGAVADLGSGAGLPGIVVAIARPDVAVDLIESQRRRLAFLELAVERLGLTNAIPVGIRVERVGRRYDVLLARAFADAGASWAIAEPLLAPGGRLVYFAGTRLAADVLERVPAGRKIVPPPPWLASAGPLVIMTRQ